MSKPKSSTKPFIPSEDEQGNPIVDPLEITEPIPDEEPPLEYGKDESKPEGGTTPQEITEPVPDDPPVEEYKVFKSMYSGMATVPVIIDGKKKYLAFNKHTYRTNDAKEIEALYGIWREDKDKIFNQRRVLLEDEFLEHTSPERVYVEVDGQNLHVGEIREAIKIAKANGWKPTGKKVFILPDTKSKISQGGRTASSGGV